MKSDGETTQTFTSTLPSFKWVKFRGNREAAAERQNTMMAEALDNPLTYQKRHRVLGHKLNQPE